MRADDRTDILPGDGPAVACAHEIYPDLLINEAVLLSALNRNHPLLGGNKRRAWFTTLAFYKLNGHDIVVERQADIDRFVLGGTFSYPVFRERGACHSVGIMNREVGTGAVQYFYGREL